MSFRGLIRRRRQLDLAPFFASWQPDGGQGDGTYLLEFRDINGGVITSVAPRAAKALDIDQNWTLFAEAVALPTGWRRMVLRENGVEIQSWLRSAHLLGGEPDLARAGLPVAQQRHGRSDLERRRCRQRSAPLPRARAARPG